MEGWCGLGSCTCFARVCLPRGLQCICLPPGGQLPSETEASLAPRHVASAPAPQQMAAPPVAAASPTAGVPQQVVATNQQMAAAPQIAAASPAPQQLVAPPQAAALEQLVAPGQQIAASPEQMAAAPQMVAAEQPSVSDGKRPRPAREVLNGLSLNFLFYHFIHYQQQAELLALSTAKINSLILRIHPVHPSTVEGLRRLRGKPQRFCKVCSN